MPLVPVWGFHYIDDENPLLGGNLVWSGYASYGLWDAYAATMLGMALSSSDAKDRKEYLGSAIGALLFNRALGFLGLIGVSDYNRIASSPYNLAEIDF